MTDLKSRLAEIAETPRPTPPTASPITAAARGRRIVRLRRAAAATVTAAAVGAVAFTVAPSDAPPPAAVTTAAGFPNPLLRPASFGWLPPGCRLDLVGLLPDGTFRLNFSDASPGPGGGAEVKLLPPSRQPEGTKPPGVTHVPKHAARPVNGHRAFWTHKPDSREGWAELQWEYAKGRWAELTVNDPTLKDERTVYRIAEGLKHHEPRPTAFPIRLKGLPKDLRIREATVDASSEKPTTLLTLDTGTRFPEGLDPTTIDYLSLSVVEAVPLREHAKRPVIDAQGDRKPLVPNTTVDGRPAYEGRTGEPRTPDGHLRGAPNARTRWLDQHPDQRQRVLYVFGVRGFDVKLTASGPTLDRIQKIGGLRAVYAYLTLLGKDRSKWTTTPLSH